MSRGKRLSRCSLLPCGGRARSACSPAAGGSRRSACGSSRSSCRRSARSLPAARSSTASRALRWRSRCCSRYATRRACPSPGGRWRSRSRAGTWLERRRTGSDEVRIRGSGLEARVAVAVTLPSAVEGWVFGGRGSFVGFVYSFKPLSYVQGRAGFRGEVFAGHALTARLRVELGTGFGSLKADTGRVEVSVALTQQYVRAEYGLSREAAVRPVVSLGGGGFKILSDDTRHIVYHSSLFWLAGAGGDCTLGRRVSGELRIETHQLNEMTSSIVNGHVGALTMVTAGVRLRP